MSNIKRPNTVIKSTITPIPTEVKVKVSNAFQNFISKIKEKHL
jgi:hypothetical protein